jgi:PAS domain S-box-containing protein
MDGSINGMPGADTERNFDVARLRAGGLGRAGDRMSLPGGLKADRRSRARRPFGEDTIRVRLLRLAVLLLLPGLSLAGMATWRSYLIDKNTTEVALTDTARALALTLNSHVQQATTLLKTIAASGNLSQGLGGFAAVAQSFGGDLSLRDQNGNALPDAVAGPASRAMARAPGEGGRESVTVAWVPDSRGETRDLRISMPFAGDWTPGGSLTVTITHDRLQKILDGLVSLKDGWVGAIFRSNGTIAVCSTAAGGLCPGRAEAPARSNEAVVAGKSSEGEKTIGAVVAVPQNPMTVEVLTSAQHATGASGLSLLLLVSEGAALITLGMLGALLVASGISQPVEALAGAARHLGESDALPQIPGRLLEADEVARAMRTANRALIERRAALSDTNASLAAAVEIRTAELAEVNRALEEQRSQLGLILDHMPIGVVVYSVDSTLLYANPEARRLMGMPAQDQDKGRHTDLGVQLFKDGQPLSANKAPPARARRGVKTERELLVMQRPDGSKLDIEVSAGPVRDSTEHVALSVTTLQDVSARLEAEEARRRSQRLEAVGQLTGGVAHEFNNLLMAVSGCLDLLAPYVRGDRAHSLLESAARATDRGGRLTRQLLAFARRQNLHSEPVDLGALVNGMKELIASTLGRSIEIIAETDPQGWHAMADAPQLELVLLNLSINARDAMPGGGRLVISTGNAHLGPPRRAEEPPAGEYVALRVTDNGQGMPPDVLNRVFEPFFTTKDVGRGSGLGLPQVLGVAQQLGGGVIIDSTVGVGTTVSVFLPRAATEAAPVRRATLAPPKPRALQGVRMLLVDDDDEVRQVARVMLEEMGSLVIEADCGAEALLRLQANPALDLMLVDYTMPQMTGTELAHQVRLKLPGLPVVLMTGYSAATLGESGPDVFEILQKPFRAEALAETLLRALGDWTPPGGATGPDGDMPSPPGGPEDSPPDQELASQADMHAGE